MNSDRSFYTELEYRHKCVDDYGERVITLHEPVWDMDGMSFLKMFRSIYIGAGYPEGSFENLLVQYLSEESDMRVFTRDELEEHDDNVVEEAVSQLVPESVVESEVDMEVKVLPLGDRPIKDYFGRED